MNEKKDIYYYRNLLHKDSIALLGIAIIFIILSLVFLGGGNEDATPIFLKSILFVVFSAIIVCKKEAMQKYIGVLAIIAGCLMVLTSIGDFSLFGIVYLLLGIFQSVHAILYLNKFEKENLINQIPIYTEVEKKTTNLKYLTIIPIVLSFLFIFGMIAEEMAMRITIFASICAVNIANIIGCVVLTKKYKPSVLVYIMLSLSILATLVNGMFLVDNVGSAIHTSMKENSETYFIERCETAANEISEKISIMDNLIHLNVNVGENKVIKLDNYLALDNVNWIDVSELLALQADGYVCDGYTVLEWHPNINFTSYHDISDDRFYNMHAYFKQVKTYLRCNGKYSYQTSGFTEKKLES